MEYRDRFREVDRIKILQAGKRSLRKEDGKKALAYLKDERGFSDDIINQFEFGYCPEHIDHQLKGKIIHPIRDSYGELLAVTSRHPDKNVERRFWHETFDKGSNLFGLNFAKRHVVKSGRAIVVEGEYDVIYLHLKKFTMAVGVCGSAFSLVQASLLSRYCQDVFFVFDGDEAGRRASDKVKRIYKDNYMSTYGINYFYVNLPSGKDPDDFVKENGASEFRKILKESRESMELNLD